MRFHSLTWALACLAGLCAVPMRTAAAPTACFDAQAGLAAQTCQATLLQGDPHLRVDSQGRLYAADRFNPPAQAAPMPRGARPAPLSDTFKLHSRPSAKRTIYLNFVGDVLQDTAWNEGGGPITAPAFDMDGNPAAFSDLELERIQFIWQRVAEDYSPFDIDVTTHAPAPERLTRSTESDGEFGTTALITTHDVVDFPGADAISYIGAFDEVGDFHKPALIFYDMLRSEEKWVAETVSHEVGHNIGLLHDGPGYYPGHGSGAAAWAPIMGNGLERPVTQWSRGEYAEADNHEDDLAMIVAHGGRIRPDDHGNTPKNATKLKVKPDNKKVRLSGGGVIETDKDVDAFSFVCGKGSVSLEVNGDSRESNLDLLVTVTNEAGEVIATSNPADSLNAPVRFKVTAKGKYFVSVEGVGYGDPAIDGFSGYASIGQYEISGTAAAP